MFEFKRINELSAEMFTHSLNCLLIDLRFSALPFGNKNNRHFHGLRRASSWFSLTDACRWETASEIPNLQQQIDEFQHFIMRSTVSIRETRFFCAVRIFSDASHYWRLQVNAELTLFSWKSVQSCLLVSMQPIHSDIKRKTSSPNWNKIQYVAYLMYYTELWFSKEPNLIFIKLS